MEGSNGEGQWREAVEMRTCVGAGGKAAWGAPSRADHKFRRLRENRDYAIFNNPKRMSHMWSRKQREHGTIKPCEATEIL